MARSDRRRTAKTKSDQIEFPGIMGFMQQNMRVIVLVGLVVLLASIGTPIFTSILSSNEPSND
ncbi:MAG TPA: hypothetical protein EYQ00_03300, partial [Dehalococcoidia bacterium]|nr:hypothetical protein [Dehalococcoidia bacterium]